MSIGLESIGTVDARYVFTFCDECKQFIYPLSHRDYA
jgi:hypothetical protein